MIQSDFISFCEKFNLNFSKIRAELYQDVTELRNRHSHESLEVRYNLENEITKIIEKLDQDLADIKDSHEKFIRNI